MPRVGQRAHVHRFGAGGHPVLVLDEATGDLEGIIAAAQALAPFPPAKGNGYPGLRRPIANADVHAAEYARRLLGDIAGLVNAVFGFDGFDLLDASFSMVTARPETLRPEQRAPHFDSTDPLYLAVLHYVSGTEDSGTAFYRQRATAIERVDEANVGRFVAAARAEAGGWRGFVGDGNASFERIGKIEGVADRLIVYQGGLLHSGIIPATMRFSDDPRRGRLTTNLFVRGRRRG